MKRFWVLVVLLGMLVVPVGSYAQTDTPTTTPTTTPTATTTNTYAPTPTPANTPFGNSQAILVPDTGDGNVRQLNASDQSEERDLITLASAKYIVQLQNYNLVVKAGSTLKEYEDDGTFVKTWACSGTNSYDMVVHPDTGNVLLAGWLSDNIRECNSSDGSAVGIWATLGADCDTPYHMEIGPTDGHLYVSCIGTTHNIVVFHRNDKQVVNAGFLDTGYESLRQFTFGTTNVFVSDPGVGSADEVEEYNSSGVWQNVFTTAPLNPQGLGVTNAGTIAVMNYGNPENIEEYDQDTGALITDEWGPTFQNSIMWMYASVEDTPTPTPSPTPLSNRRRVIKASVLN